MLRSNSKSLGNNVISPEEERERLQWEELNPSRIFSRPHRAVAALRYGRQQAGMADYYRLLGVARIYRCPSQ